MIPIHMGKPVWRFKNDKGLLGSSNGRILGKSAFFNVLGSMLDG